jgi:folate-binding protein YgfZ
MVALEVYEGFKKLSAALERPEVRTLSLTGPDRVKFLNGMISQEIGSLQPGQGTIAVKTSNKGRVEALLRVRATADALLIDLSSVVAEKVLATLSKFIIMDDCAIADISDSREVVAIYGPEADKRAGASEMAPHSFLVRDQVTIVRDVMLGVPGYEAHVPPGAGIPLIESWLDQGAKRASWSDLNVLRVEAGAPIDGRELDEEVIPMEARLEAAISTVKGCYIGQEVIARAINLGGVKHILVGLILGEAIAEGAQLYSSTGDQKTGELTSVVYSPALARHIALGFVRRVDERVGTVLSARIGSSQTEAVVTELPFA